MQIVRIAPILECLNDGIRQDCREKAQAGIMSLLVCSADMSFLSKGGYARIRGAWLER